MGSEMCIRDRPRLIQLQPRLHHVHRLQAARLQNSPRSRAFRQSRRRGVRSSSSLDRPPRVRASGSRPARPARPVPRRPRRALASIRRARPRRAPSKFAPSPVVARVSHLDDASERSRHALDERQQRGGPRRAPFLRSFARARRAAEPAQRRDVVRVRGRGHGARERFDRVRRARECGGAFEFK